MLLLGALCVPSLGAAGAFAAQGAWPILPLAGLEMLALGIGLYVANRKLQYRHIITLTPETVTVDKGYNAPAQSWHFRRAVAGLTIVPQRHPWDSPRVALHDADGAVSIGDFLNRNDQLALIALLQREIRVRAQSPCLQVSF